MTELGVLPTAARSHITDCGCINAKPRGEFAIFRARLLDRLNIVCIKLGAASAGPSMHQPASNRFRDVLRGSSPRKMAWVYARFVVARMQAYGSIRALTTRKLKSNMGCITKFSACSNNSVPSDARSLLPSPAIVISRLVEFLLKTVLEFFSPEWALCSSHPQIIMFCSMSVNGGEDY